MLTELLIGHSQLLLIESLDGVHCLSWDELDVFSKLAVDPHSHRMIELRVHFANPIFSQHSQATKGRQVVSSLESIVETTVQIK